MSTAYDNFKEETRRRSIAMYTVEKRGRKLFYCFCFTLSVILYGSFAAIYVTRTNNAMSFETQYPR